MGSSHIIFNQTNKTPGPFQLKKRTAFAKIFTKFYSHTHHTFKNWWLCARTWSSIDAKLPWHFFRQLCLVIDVDSRYENVIHQLMLKRKRKWTKSHATLLFLNIHLPVVRSCVHLYTSCFFEIISMHDSDILLVWRVSFSYSMPAESKLALFCHLAARAQCAQA